MTSVLAFILTLIAPIFIQNEYLDADKIWLPISVIHMLTTFIGGWLIVCLFPKPRIVLAASIGGGWLLATLLAAAVVVEGSGRYIFVNCCSCVIGSGMAIWLQFYSNKRNKRRKKVRKR